MFIEFINSIFNLTTVSNYIGSKGKFSKIFTKSFILNYMIIELLFIIPKIIFITFVLTIQSEWL
jgi:hypothetical protein